MSCDVGKSPRDSDRYFNFHATDLSLSIAEFMKSESSWTTLTWYGPVYVGMDRTGKSI